MQRNLLKRNVILVHSSMISIHLLATLKKWLIYFKNNVSVYFSQPNNPDVNYTEIEPNTDKTFGDFSLNLADIEEAIDEVSKYAACGEDDIPALVLKECKSHISYPLLLYWT